MTKLDRLNSFLSERLTAVLNEVIYTVSMTMKEYEEETTRILKENHRLKELLKLSGVTEANNPDVMAFYLPRGQRDSSLELVSEPQEKRDDPHNVKEEKRRIKTEQCSYYATVANDADSEAKTEHTYAAYPECTVGPVQCTSAVNAPAVDQEIGCEFPAEMKVEPADADSSSESTEDTDSTDGTDSSEGSWSLQNCDMLLETRDQRRAKQAASQRPCKQKQRCSAASDTQNRPVEFRAAFSFSDRVVCNNKQHCSSKQCEMQRAIPKSSPVWKYFSLKEGDCSKAVCLICKTVISRGIKGYTTSALLRHLRGKHSIC